MSGPRSVEGGFISGHDLAHAEINALLDIKEKPRPECYSWMLLTTLQPCPQCAAATALNSIRHIQYAAPDMWVAESNLLTCDPYIARKGVQVTRAPAEVQRWCLRLTLVSWFEEGRDLQDPLIQTFHEYADDVRHALNLHESGVLLALRERKAPLAEALAVLA